MSGLAPRPAWLPYLFALLMLAVAGYFAVLLVASARSRRRAGSDVELSHVTMGVAMAGMFVGPWSFGPSTFWELVFSAFLVWFVVRTIQSVLAFGLHVPHTAIHAVMSLGMLLMYRFPAVGGPSTAMSGMSASVGGRIDPGVAFLIAVTLFGSAIFTLASPTKGRSVYGIHSELTAVSAAAAATGRDVACRGGRGSRPPVGLAAVVERPQFVDATHVVMAVAMGFMLVLML